MKRSARPSLRPAEAAARARLEDAFRVGVEAVDAGAAVRRALAREGRSLRVAGAAVPDGAGLVVIALGKAAAAMAESVEAVAGDRIVGGCVVTKDGHGLAQGRLPVLEAGHPVPDARCEAAARRALAAAAATGSEDLLLVLLSGGASALCACPAPGLTLSDLAVTTELLLACGADIHEINTVRKHLSELSAGRLALAAGGARVEVLAVSDVRGDPVDVIASGPCAADPSSFADALAVVTGRGLLERLPGPVREVLGRGARGELPETPKPGDPRLASVRHTLVATNADARRAARDSLAAAGHEAVDLGEVLAGEARDAAAALLAAAVERGRAGVSALVAGGETVVTLRGDGRGGRSQELALAAAVALDGRPGGPALLAAGTDGTDGPTDAAGAFADPGSVGRGRARGVDARRALEANDAYGFFDVEGGLLRTGPTRTNTMDLVLIELSPPRGRGAGRDRQASASPDNSG